MKRFILFLILLTASSLLYSLPEEDHYEKTLLWRIEGKGLAKPSYLYGTIHITDPRVFNFADSVMPALLSCDYFANEVTVDSAYVFYSILSAMVKRELNTYFYLPQTKARLKKVWDKEKFGKTLFENPESFPPWYLNLMTSSIDVKSLHDKDSDSSSPYRQITDLYLNSIAKTAGKQCFSLEDISNYFKYLRFDPPSLQEALLNQTLDAMLKENPEETDALENKLIELYADEDIEGIQELFDRLVPQNSLALVQKLGERNEDMADHFEKLAVTGSVFSTAGCAHLPGANGLIEILRRRGYTVEPVERTYTGESHKITPKISDTFDYEFVNNEAGFKIKFPVVVNSTEGFNPGKFALKDPATNIEYNVECEPVESKSTFNNAKVTEMALRMQFKKPYYEKNDTLAGLPCRILKFKKDQTGIAVCMTTLRDYNLSLAAITSKCDSVFDKQTNLFFASFDTVSGSLRKKDSDVLSELGMYVDFPGKCIQKSVYTRLPYDIESDKQLAYTDTSSKITYLAMVKHSNQLQLTDTTEFKRRISETFKPGQFKNAIRTKAIDVSGFYCRGISGVDFKVTKYEGYPEHCISALRGSKLFSISATFPPNREQEAKKFTESLKFMEYPSEEMHEIKIAGQSLKMPFREFYSKPVLSPTIYSHKFSKTEYVNFCADRLTGIEFTFIPVKISKYLQFDSDSSAVAFYAGKYFYFNTQNDTDHIFTKETPSADRGELRINYPGSNINRIKYAVSADSIYFLSIEYNAFDSSHNSVSEAFASFRPTLNPDRKSVRSDKTDALVEMLNSDTTPDESDVEDALNNYANAAPLDKRFYDAVLKLRPEDSLYATTPNRACLNMIVSKKDTAFAVFVESNYDRFTESTGNLSRVSQALIDLSTSLSVRLGLNMVADYRPSYAKNKYDRYIFFGICNDSLELYRPHLDLIKKIADNGTSDFEISVIITEMIHAALWKPSDFADREARYAFLADSLSNARNKKHGDSGKVERARCCVVSSKPVLSSFVMAPNDSTRYNAQATFSPADESEDESLGEDSDDEFADETDADDFDPDYAGTLAAEKGLPPSEYESDYGLYETVKVLAAIAQSDSSKKVLKRVFFGEVPNFDCSQLKPAIAACLLRLGEKLPDSSINSLSDSLLTCADFYKQLKYVGKLDYFPKAKRNQESVTASEFSTAGDEDTPDMYDEIKITGYITPGGEFGKSKFAVIKYKFCGETSVNTAFAGPYDDPRNDIKTDAVFYYAFDHKTDKLSEVDLFVEVYKEYKKNTGIRKGR